MPYANGVCGPKIPEILVRTYLVATLEDPSDPVKSNIVITYDESLATEFAIGAYGVSYLVTVQDYREFISDEVYDFDFELISCV